MDKLIALKTVIARVYLDINKDGRKEILVPLSSMFHKPLVVFDETYKTFIETVAKDAGLFDRWLNIQMQVYTELQDDQAAIEQFIEMFKKVMKTTDGAEWVLVSDNPSFNSTSYVVALAFRVYLDAIVLDEDVRAVQ